MATNPTKKRIQELRAIYDRLRKGKESLLRMIDEAELSESVYNSNAIENSTLTLKETERILLEMEVSRDVSVREVFEAKNLARVMEYLPAKIQENNLSSETFLLLHEMLMSNIDDRIAGRFREKGEYVRVGTHLAPPPERVKKLIADLLLAYGSDLTTYFVDAIAKFHLEFERIHPFNDGNGRIGRVIMNGQFLRLGFPTIIIRDKEKKTYYRAFRDYNDKKQTKTMERVVTLALLESLHKRIAYLQGDTIITLAAFSRDHRKSPSALLNAAMRQTIPAFREKGVWKIGATYSHRRTRL
ncbi:MAG: hypothetical protein Greene101449_81 [Candidatus Peregrinibacteria bacterium Greene1014_49]|nr:MAG: hypothetical protein Greene101449_81 [Candidatus Peregrinibacteria bacterium Greene1014_49]